MGEAALSRKSATSEPPSGRPAAHSAHMNGVTSERLNRPSRFFFVAMACAVVLTVFIGFAPSFYLRGAFLQVFSVWVGLFLLQTVLASRGSYTMHRRLGWVAAGTAAAMVVLVTAAVVEQSRGLGKGGPVCHASRGRLSCALPGP